MASRHAGAETQVKSSGTAARRVMSCRALHSAWCFRHARRCVNFALGQRFVRQVLRCREGFIDGSAGRFPGLPASRSVESFQVPAPQCRAFRAVD